MLVTIDLHHRKLPLTTNLNHKLLYKRFAVVDINGFKPNFTLLEPRSNCR